MSINGGMFTDVKKRLLKRGIMRRWIRNAFLIAFGVLFVGVGAYSIAIYNYYYTGVTSSLNSRAEMATSFFTSYIAKTYAEYYDSAYKYINSFDEADTIELQFINMSGRIVISSYSVTAGGSPGTDDIKQAFQTGKTSSWVGRDPMTNERIACVSSPLMISNGSNVGVMRYVTSTRLVDEQIRSSILTVSGIGLLIVAMTIFLNFLLIRSLVSSNVEITDSVRNIADGGYGLQITKKYTDELGDLAGAVNELSMKISQSERSQMEFVSSVSHELRTPLTAITGWAETLGYTEGLDGDTRKGIEIIQKEAQRLTKMVEELLEFTRMQDGRFTLNVELIDVGAELENSIFTYMELLKQDNIILAYEPYDGDLPLVNGDPERLRQVFLNIIDNAAKYGGSGNRIDVNIEPRGGCVEVSIRDFGPGIPPDELELVKKKFYKGSSKSRGSGIGLAVCDEIVKYHGGELILNNAEGGGTIVYVRLPVAET